MKTPLKRAIAALRRLTLTDQDRAATVARVKTLQAIDRKRLKQPCTRTESLYSVFHDTNGVMRLKVKRAA